MTDERRSRLHRVAGVLGRLSPAVLAVLGVAIALGAGGGPADAHGALADAFLGRPGAVGAVAGASVRAMDAPVASAVTTPAPAQEMPDFTHSDHESVACQSCHTSVETHGALSVTTLTDCRSCHHTEPVSRPCSTCHSGADAPDEAFPRTQAVVFSVGTRDPRRVMVFPHDRHSDLDCATCHTQGLALDPPADLVCASCHEDHHTPESTCASCHVQAPASAHPTEQAHITCGGSGCHAEVPFATLPRTRAFCLGCHQDQVDHEPGGTCSVCHVLPAPLPQAGAGR